MTGGDSGIGRPDHAAPRRDGLLVNNVATQETVSALDHLPSGSAIINTGSVDGLRGNKSLLDYSASKGAVHSWTFAMAQLLVDRDIRVNCVAPGPVWTPLIPSTMGEQKVEKFGGQVPMKRAAHPDEIAPSYVFFARTGCRRSTPVRCSPRSVARRCRADDTSGCLVARCGRGVPRPVLA